MTTISLARYTVLDQRDPNHWALWVESNSEDVTVQGDTILQVEDDKGGVGYYVANPVRGRAPQSSTRFLDVTTCGSVVGGYEVYVIQVIQATPVDNGSTTWNCQAWVIEALDNAAATGAFVWNAGVRDSLVQARQHWQ